MNQLNKTVRILKIATCKTLSNKADLIYHIGSTSDNAIHFRIFAGNGGGTFSQEWISLETLQQHLKKQSEGITSIVLYPLFRGKSVNTPSFLLSVLKHEGLVDYMKGKRRQYECSDPKPFLEQVKQLIDSDVDLDPDDEPKNSPIKKRTPSTPTPKRKTKKSD